MFKAELKDVSTGEVWGRNSFYSNAQDAQAWIDSVKVKLEAKGKTIEVVGPVDLTQDPVWVLEQVQKNRAKEYPSIAEVVEALIEAVAENRHEKINLLQAKREAVKNKYPKN